jgi:hypothetical protein
MQELLIYTTFTKSELNNLEITFKTRKLTNRHFNIRNQKVQTDRTITNNKSEYLIRDSKQGTCMLTDVAIPGDINLVKKEAEDILKYKDIII